jgi:hypothetical protein
LIDGEAEGGMGADQHLVVAARKRPSALTLPPLSVVAGRVAQVPFRRHMPVSPEAELGLSASSLKLAPMDFSGTTMMACFSP